MLCIASSYNIFLAIIINVIIISKFHEWPIQRKNNNNINVHKNYLRCLIIDLGSNGTKFILDACILIWILMAQKMEIFAIQYKLLKMYS